MVCAAAAQLGTSTVPASFRGVKKSGGAKGRGPWLLPKEVEDQLVGDGKVLSKNPCEVNGQKRQDGYTRLEAEKILGHAPRLPFGNGSIVTIYTLSKDGAWKNLHVECDCILCRIDAVCTAYLKLIRASKNSTRTMEIIEFRQDVGLHGDMDSSDDDNKPEDQDGIVGPVGPVDQNDAAVDIDYVNPPEVAYGESGKVVETLESFMKKISSVTMLTESMRTKCMDIWESNRKEIDAMNEEADQGGVGE